MAVVKMKKRGPFLAIFSKDANILNAGDSPPRESADKRCESSLIHRDISTSLAPFRMSAAALNRRLLRHHSPTQILRIVLLLVFLAGAGLTLVATTGAGGASALLGTIQFGTGGLAGAIAGRLGETSAAPMCATLSVCAFAAMLAFHGLAKADEPRC
jgi:hypothetical protein